MPQTLLVIADDLTGAADTAARCVHVGLHAEIYVSGSAPATLPAGVLVLTTNSRHLQPSRAYQRIWETVETLPATERCLWYKKIDSTLRGNIGSELNALVEACSTQCGDRPVAFICPAFPAQNRGLQSGYLVATDLKLPRTYLPALLQQQSQRKIAAVSLGTVRRSSEHLAATILRQLNAGYEYFVLDALTDTDLRNIRDAVLELPSLPIFCGSAGLARILAEEMGESPEATRVRRPGSKPFALDKTFVEQVGCGNEKVLLVVGSASSTAQAQRKHLQKSEDVVAIEVNFSQEKEQLDAIAAGNAQRCLLYLPPPEPEVDLEGSEAGRLSELLAQRAVSLIDKLRPRLIVLVGGETAGAVATQLGIKHLTVVAELYPGVGLMYGTGHRDQKHWFILKSGNHGTVDLLQDLTSPQALAAIINRL